MGDNNIGMHHFSCNSSSTCSDDISHLVRQIFVRSSSSPPPPSSAVGPQGGGGENARRLSRSHGGWEQGISAVGSVDRFGSGNVRLSCGSSSLGARENETDEFDCESEEGLEALVDESAKPAPRSSSKRSRAAEVHNLSEKRRRSRINEKMKALQNLIPNSNKTDKASMLDEAIEYLKQLQLQVQMLSFRNGLSLHPMCLPGTLQPVQLPHMRIGSHEENQSLHPNLLDPVTMNQGNSAENVFNLPNHCTGSKPVSLPNMPVMTNSGIAFGWESPIQAQFGPLQPLASSPDFCRQEMLLQTQLNINQSRTNQSASLPLDSQAIDAKDTGSLNACVMGRDGLQRMQSKNIEHGHILSQHLAR